mgnify:CR=1 FL=1
MLFLLFGLALLAALAFGAAKTAQAFSAVRAARTQQQPASSPWGAATNWLVGLPLLVLFVELCIAVAMFYFSEMSF